MNDPSPLTHKQAQLFYDLIKFAVEHNMTAQELFNLLIVAKDRSFDKEPHP